MRRIPPSSPTSTILFDGDGFSGNGCKSGSDGNSNSTSTTTTTTTTVRTLPTLTDDPMTWKNQSLISVTQITNDGFRLLQRVTCEMRHLVRTDGGDDRFQHRLLATVFYEASTRTSCSFQAAMQRLGGKILHVDGNGNSSANKKKESLHDTIRCIECYVDAIVLRHPTTGSVPKVYHSSSSSSGSTSTMTKPLINAGDGIGEHPTQALLDAFTIFDELQTQRPKIIVFLGDLKHGRTVHSLAKLLAKPLCTAPGPALAVDNDDDDDDSSSDNNNVVVFRFCAPPTLSIPTSVLDYCKDYGIQYEQYNELTTECCDGAQVLYVTRIQKERFESETEYNAVKGSYVVSKSIMNQFPPQNNMIVLHPLPRIDEIDTEVDSDPRAAYFRQMENGMYVRMAILALLLGKSEKEQNPSPK